MAHGLRLLSHRPRTEYDLRNRLEQRFTTSTTASALHRLRELGYVNDYAWATAYLESTRASLRSSWLLSQELRAKGIAPEIAADVTSLHDDNQAALAAARAAIRKLSSNRKNQASSFEQRLYKSLVRRGFASTTIQHALSQLRAENST